jgi:multidrug efflux pump
MGEITSALIGITLVLTAVFVPMALFGGSTGVIYRQFSVTIVSAMSLSVMVALVLTPALCATLLKQTEKPKGRFFQGFNRRYDSLQGAYHGRLKQVVGRPLPWMLAFVVIVAAMIFLYMRIPTSFLPEEDQGQLMVVYTLPVGSTMEQTQTLANEAQKLIKQTEGDNIRAMFLVTGRGQGGSGQNTGQGFVLLKDWDERPGTANSASAMALRLNRLLTEKLGTRAQVFVLAPPSIRGLGNAAGFDMYLQDRKALAAPR